MRVALVTTSWPRFPGDPSGHFVEAEAAALTRCGDEVVVIAPMRSAAFGWPGFAARVKERPARLFGAARWVASARRELADAKADRVIAHWAVPCGWPIAGSCNLPLEVVSHGGDVRLLAGLPRVVASRLVRPLATRAERWRFVAAHLADALVARMPADVARAVDRIAVVAPCVIDVPPPDGAAVAAKRAEVGAPFAVCVARLVASKRVDAAIAWSASQRLPLVVVGDGPERARLAGAARSIGARVTFVGRAPRDEALAWIAAADVLVQASRTEGASTVVREAEALATRVAVL
jgi:glycosyltransferase involved in cell wall biosynthesis